MQTFLPHISPLMSARALDNKRLGKQRAEAKQILDILDGKINAWKNHPAVRMWRGYEDFLRYYLNIMILEWIQRGCKNNMKLHSVSVCKSPHWLTDDRLHYSHRANLVRKLPDHYRQQWPEVDPNTPYWWPVELIGKKQQKELEEFWGSHGCVRLRDNPQKILLIE